jgi:glycine/D-amino acid oxidase-like deaminating enzyme/nitrite reductase/ring-hydroxylating ferredoxin subunit
MTSLWLDGVDNVESDVFHAGAHYDSIVVGAGLTGLATALLLTQDGQRVAVLEARGIGAVTTGNTTAKISLLQGTRLSQIRKKHSAKTVRAYVDANRDAQQWLVDFCAAHGVAVQREAAYTYSRTEKDLSSVRQELEAAQEAGLDAQWASTTELPYPIAGAIELADQAQFDPLPALLAMASEVRSRGGEIVVGVRVTKARHVGERIQVETEQGELTADHVVLATGTPILDRAGYFARLEPLRSYAAAFLVDGPIPRGMYLSADSPSRSLRYAPTPEGDLLLVGGNGHTVGRSKSPQRQVDDLVTWTRGHFPSATLKYWWSAQDYESVDSLPYAGPLLPGQAGIQIATGFDKWGMTNAVAAAMVIARRALGKAAPQWGGAFDSWNLRQLTGVGMATKLNAEVGVYLAKGWLAPLLAGSPDGVPADGIGRVERDGLIPTAVCSVDGQTHRVSAVCPHLGGIVSWNDAEKSWDCPLHGSRFAADGTLLEGPATRGLAPRS